MEPCTLKAGNISLLVQEQILPPNEDGAWVSEWPTECQLKEGTIIRIPYNPDEIASLVRDRTETVIEETLDNTPINEGAPAPPVLPDLPQATDTGEDSEPLTTETPMPEDQTAENTELNAHEVQPSDPSGGLAGELNSLAQTTGQDSTLTIVLAILAVVGGGAAWKFYRQHSEQKHDQKMAQMKLDAKAKGMEGQSPGPCQTIHAQLKAEVEELKSRLDKTDKKMALSADFDGDDIERKVRKLEKWRKSLEEEDDE